MTGDGKTFDVLGERHPNKREKKARKVFPLWTKSLPLFFPPHRVETPRTALRESGKQKQQALDFQGFAGLCEPMRTKRKEQKCS